ncbi:MAG: hypothetical protein MHPSP_004695, partial [Paramarteilia canceri]
KENEVPSFRLMQNAAGVDRCHSDVSSLQELLGTSPRNVRLGNSFYSKKSKDRLFSTLR